MRRRPARWSDAPNASDLAALVRCEAEAVWERNTGVTNQSGTRALRSRTGMAVHARAQAEMEAFHNSRPRRAAPLPLRSGGSTPAPAVPRPAPAALPLQLDGRAAGPLPGAAPGPGATGTAPGSRASDRRCFVATSLYGLDDPRTEALRAFRDRSLMPSAAGRALVSAYYRTSPALVSVLDRAPALRSAARLALDLIRAVLVR